MSNQFLKLRRSSVQGKIPTTSSIDFGEIALNTYDGLAFIKKSGSLGEQVVTLGSTNGSFTGSFSGSFTGSLQGTSSFAILSVSSSYPITVTGSTLRSVSPAGGIGGNTFHSIFFGDRAGEAATNSEFSNFLGRDAGIASTNAQYSNFLGFSAGANATNANSSNFLGYQAGGDAAFANNSNFLGVDAGFQATSASFSNFFGYRAGYQVTGVEGEEFRSNFIGFDAGREAINANNSNFLGYQAGQSATNANRSNFLGQGAGFEATNANNSNFLGAYAGEAATDAFSSNFIGDNAGFGAAFANYSNFIGFQAGNGATNANYSNFIGYDAGKDATDANNSNFIGDSAGQDAANANNSNFFGYDSGFQAISASNSNFIGNNAGYQAASASYSTLIGYQAGYKGAGSGIRSNNIIIGTNITLEDQRQDSINIGGLIFGTGSYSSSIGNPFSGSTNGRIGINQPLPQYTLDVSGSARATSLIINTSGQERTITTFYGTGSDGNNIFIGGGGLSSGTGGGASVLGSNNTSLGAEALLVNTTGYYGTAIGWRALYFNTTGRNNTASGNQALYLNTTGRDNTANGFQSLFSSQTGILNTAIGSQALFANTTGSRNTALGVQAGYGGSNNNTTGDDNIFIGYQSVGVNAAESNRTWIGNSSTLSTWLAGNVLIGTTTNAGFKLDVNGTTRLQGTVTAPSITGSLEGTASWASNAVTASYALTASFLIGQTPSWNLTGNSGTNESTNFIGTTDLQSLTFKANNVERMKFDDNGITTIQAPTLSSVLVVGYNSNSALPFTISDGVQRAVSIGTGAGNVALFMNSHTTTRAGFAFVDRNSGVLLNIVNNASGRGTLTNAQINPIAGTSTAAQAPMKFTAGTLLTVPETGSVEYIANTFVFQSDSILLGTTPNASARLQIDSTTKGILVPRMTTTQRNAIASPAEGLLVYVTGSNDGFSYYNSGSNPGWHTLLSNSGSQSISGSLTLTGTLTAQTIVAQVITSSTLYSSGSNVFGNSLSNTQVFTGSVSITGSLSVNGSSVITSNQTSSMSVLSSSFATTASFAANAFVLPSLTSGSVLFSSGSTIAQDNANFFWDNTNKRLGIGTTTPTNVLTINTNANSSSGIRVNNSNIGNLARAGIEIANNSGTVASLSIWGTATPYANKTIFEGGKDFIILTDASVASGGTSKFQIAVGGYNAVSSPQFTIHGTGNVSVNTTTDTGFKLDVAGTTRFTGNSLVTGSLTVTGSLNVTAGITGSLFGTASWANNAVTASYILNAVSSSFASTASYVLNAVSASFATTASFATSASWAPASSNIYTADGTLSATTRTISYNVSAPTGLENKLILRNLTVTGGANNDFIFQAANNTLPSLQIWNPNYGGQLSFGGNGIISFGGGRLNLTTSAHDIAFFPSGVERVRFFTTGNVGIGTATDAGFKLDVNGTTRFVGNSLVTGNLNVTSAITASQALISGSGTQRLIVVGSGSAQPIFTVQGSQGELFSITDSLSGSLFSVNDISGLPILETFSDSTTLMGSYLAPALFTTKKTTTTNSGSFVIYNIPTGSYDGLYVDYTARSGSNARAGQIMAIWNGSSVNFTETTTTDFGTTSNLLLGVSISGSNMAFTGSVATGSGWVIKSIIRSI